MLRRNGPVVKSVESVLRLEGSLWWEIFAQCLAIPSLVDYIYIFGGCCSVTEFCKVQSSLCILQVLRCPIRSITAWQSSSGHEPNFVALAQGATYIWQGDHQVGHWPTF